MMAAGSGHDLHQVRRCTQKRRQSLSRGWDVHPPPQLRLLGGDAGRAVVRVADAGRDTPDRLNRGVRKRHTIGAERQRLDEIRRHPKAASDDQRNVPAGPAIEMRPRAGQRGDRRHAYVIRREEARVLPDDAAELTPRAHAKRVQVLEDGEIRRPIDRDRGGQRPRRARVRDQPIREPRRRERRHLDRTAPPVKRASGRRGDSTPETPRSGGRHERRQPGIIIAGHATTGPAAQGGRGQGRPPAEPNGTRRLRAELNVFVDQVWFRIEGTSGSCPGTTPGPGGAFSSTRCWLGSRPATFG